MRIYHKNNTSFFLNDKDGHVDGLIMRYLKPKIGLGTILNDLPYHPLNMIL